MAWPIQWDGNICLKVYNRFGLNDMRIDNWYTWDCWFIFQHNSSGEKVGLWINLIPNGSEEQDDTSWKKPFCLQNSLKPSWFSGRCCFAIKVAQRDLWIYSAIFVDILSIFTHISSMSDLLYLLATNLVAIFSGKNIAILPTHIVEI